MSVRIDASGDYLNRTASAPGQYPLTVTFWLYITTDRNAYGALFLIANSGGTSFVGFNLSSSGTNLQISVNGNATNGSNLNVGQWYHIACVIASDTSQKMYLNGVLDINKTTVSTIFTAAQMFFGSDTVGWLNGRLDDIKIFERELTADEIKAQMWEKWPVQYRPWGFYPTFAGSSERVLDYSGNGRNLTNNGTPTDEAGPPVGWMVSHQTGTMVARAVGAYSLTMGQGSYALTGQAATLRVARLLTASQGSYTYTGQAVALKRGFVLSLAQGSYALTGQATGLTAGRLLTMAQGSYTLTGQNVNPLRGLILALAQGSYSLNGQAINFITGYGLVMAQGSYSLNGQALGLRAARLLAMGQGAYNLSGQSVSLIVGRLLTVNQGSYTLTGQNVGLLAARLLALARGNYSLNGQALGLTVGRLLTASQGAYNLTGQSVSLIAPRVLALAQGSYILTGQSVTLTAGILVLLTQTATIYSGAATATIKTGAATADIETGAASITVRY